MEEHALTVRRTARYYTIGGGPDVQHVWIVCHGFGQLARDFLKPFDAIASPTCLVVAPEALNRYYLDARPVPHGPDSPVGATWMTREDRLNEIDDYVAYLDDVHAHVMSAVGTANPEVTALGFSQGVATVCRWASRTAARIAQVILWAGLLPSDVPTSPPPFGRARTSFVHGRADKAVDPAAVQAQRDALIAAGAAAVQIEFDGRHHLDRTVLRTLAVSPREPNTRPPS